MAGRKLDYPPVWLTPEFVIEVNYTLEGNNHAVLDYGKLQSALTAPFQTFSGKPLHHTDMDVIVAIVRNLIDAHSFLNGNKRTALFIANALLRYVGCVLPDAFNWDCGRILVEYTATHDSGKLLAFFSTHQRS